MDRKKTQKLAKSAKHSTTTSWFLAESELWVPTLNKVPPCKKTSFRPRKSVVCFDSLIFLQLNTRVVDWVAVASKLDKTTKEKPLLRQSVRTLIMELVDIILLQCENKLRCTGREIDWLDKDYYLHGFWNILENLCWWKRNCRCIYKFKLRLVQSEPETPPTSSGLRFTWNGLMQSVIGNHGRPVLRDKEDTKDHPDCYVPVYSSKTMPSHILRVLQQCRFVLKECGH